MSEISKEKVENLKEIILKRAEEQREEILKNAAEEAEKQLAAEKEKLEQDKNFILDNARRRAEENRRREAMAAERRRSMELLRVQNKMISSALARLREGFAKLAARPDYADILSGMCIEAAEALGAGSAPLKLRLTASEGKHAQAVISAVKAVYPDARIAFDPAPVQYGCLLQTESGDKQVHIDRDTMTAEAAEELTERILVSDEVCK